MSIGFIVLAACVFFAFLGLVAYGARLEQKYGQLKEEKEKQQWK